MFDFSRPESFVVIVLAALATYSLRLGGLLLASHLPKSGRIRQAMDALPGALLFSLVLPPIVAEGVWGVVAAAMTGIIAFRTRNTLLAMMAGVGVIFLQRQFF
jgi:uncharacterized membrane protein